MSTKSSLSDDEDMGWSFSWPPTVWHCFLKGRRTHTCTRSRCPSSAEPLFFLPPGTRLRFHRGTNVEWRDVEELDSAEEDAADEEERSVSLKVRAHVDGQTRSLKVVQSVKPPFFSPQSYGSEGLQLVEHTEIVLSGRTVLQLTFDPGVFGHTPLTALCQLDHPFYVKGKGATVRFEAWRPDAVEPLTLCRFPSRLDVLLSQPHRGASWDTMPRTGSGGAVPPSRTQRCQTGPQLVGVRKNQEVNEATADSSVCCGLQDEGRNIP